MKYLITNLTVPTLNLTCLRERKQHYNKDMKHYVAYKMRLNDQRRRPEGDECEPIKIT
jgi:hypothetical protein